MDHVGSLPRFGNVDFWDLDWSLGVDLDLEEYIPSGPVNRASHATCGR
jgi:hypothetical protein